MLGSEAYAIDAAGGSWMRRIAKIIDACIKLPPSITAGELLAADRYAALLALRVITFGTRYDYEYTCRHCSAVNRAACDIAADFSTKELPEGFTEPLSVKLEDAGITLGLQLMRGAHEEAIEKHVASVRAKPNGRDPGFEEVLYRTATLIKTVDGAELPILARMQMVEALTWPDHTAITDAIEAVEPGLDTSVLPTCRACGKENPMAMPFGPEFFRKAAVGRG
jgi:hypothetical protein